jgi:hypothetical protein
MPPPRISVAILVLLSAHTLLSRSEGKGANQSPPATVE